MWFGKKTEVIVPERTEKWRVQIDLRRDKTGAGFEVWLEFDTRDNANAALKELYEKLVAGDGWFMFANNVLHSTDIWWAGTKRVSK